MILDSLQKRIKLQWRRQDLLSGGAKLEIRSCMGHSRRTSGSGAAAADD